VGLGTLAQTIMVTRNTLFQPTVLAQRARPPAEHWRLLCSTCVGRSPTDASRRVERVGFSHTDCHQSQQTYGSAGTRRRTTVFLECAHPGQLASVAPTDAIERLPHTYLGHIDNGAPAKVWARREGPKNDRRQKNNWPGGPRMGSIVTGSPGRCPWAG
jgi:hypothetical protein